MPKAIIDPDEVTRFAAFLDSSSNTLKEKRRSVTAGFAQLHEVWRDEKYVQFERVFADAIKELERFEQLSETYSNFLRRKADRAHKYLDQRY